MANTIALIIIGALAGCALTAGLMLNVDQSADLTSEIIGAAITTLGAMAILAVLTFPLGTLLLRKWTATAKGDFEDIVQKISDTALAAAKQDSTGTATNARAAVLAAAAWYAPIAARRWAMHVAFNFLLAIGGLAGTALLLKQIVILKEQNNKIDSQTKLLEQQNEKIDVQTITAESQRRTITAPELLAVLQELSNMANLRSDANRSTHLPSRLQQRIVNLSRTLEPYHTIEVEDVTAYVPSAKEDIRSRKFAPAVSERRRSPERGQLLVALIEAGVDPPKDANFESADMRNKFIAKANFSQISMINVDFEGSRVSQCDFSGTDLKGSSFANSYLTEVTFEKANLKNAVLSIAEAKNVSMRSANMIGAIDVGFIPPEVDLENAIFAKSARNKFSSKTISEIPSGWKLEHKHDLIIMVPQRNDNKKVQTEP